MCRFVLVRSWVVLGLWFECCLCLFGLWMTVWRFSCWFAVVFLSVCCKFIVCCRIVVGVFGVRRWLVVGFLLV